MHDHVVRMLRDANDYLHDADILAGSLTAGPGASQLRVLALEVLLKAAQYAALGKYQPHHRYRELWEALPQDIRVCVVDAAHQRYRGHIDLSDLPSMLDDWQFVFTKGRYYFELNQYLSLGEQRENGEDWIARGAPLPEAQVRFHPDELLALAAGLIDYIEAT